MFKRILCAYIVCWIISWFLISGWVFAEDIGTNEGYFANGTLSVRQASGFAAAWSFFASAMWPVFLPGVYLTSGYAEHGWRPVWNLTVPK